MAFADLCFDWDWINWRHGLRRPAREMTWRHWVLCAGWMWARVAGRALHVQGWGAAWERAAWVGLALRAQLLLGHRNSLQELEVQGFQFYTPAPLPQQRATYITYQPSQNPILRGKKRDDWQRVGEGNQTPLECFHILPCPRSEFTSCNGRTVIRLARRNLCDV